MYFLKINKKKKFSPVNKRYVQKMRIKKIAVLLTMLALAEGSFLVWHEGRNWLDNIKLPPALTWKIQTINIITPTENLQKNISKYLQEKHIKENIPFSSKAAKKLEKLLNKNIKQIKKIKVNRQIFTKELLITAEKYTPLVYIITPENSFFVDENGQFFQDDDAKTKGGFLNIYLNDKIKSELLSKELVQFIKEIKNTSLRDSDTVILNFTEQSAQFQTHLGPVKLKNFNEVKEQISALTEILKISKEKKLPQPYFVDFTYFNKGKVYLKQSYKDL